MPALKKAMKNELWSHNKSGVTGVTFEKDRGKWRAGIQMHGKFISLGRYKNKEEAIAARKEAEKRFFSPIVLEEQMEQEKKPGEQMDIFDFIR